MLMEERRRRKKRKEDEPLFSSPQTPQHSETDEEKQALPPHADEKSRHGKQRGFFCDETFSAEPREQTVRLK
jgi:hypothetical protein